VVYIITNFELYRVFYHVAKNGNITKAAQALYITQPSVSYSIKQLEEQLGLQLLKRNSKGVSLTSEGEALFKYVEQAYIFLTAGERKMEEMKQLHSGEVKVGASDSLCKHYLLPYLRSFHEAFPDIQIRLSHGKTPEIVQRLREGQIDCAVVHLPIDETQLAVREGLTIHDCFVAGEKYRHLAQTVISLKQLLDYPIILLSHNSNTRNFVNDYAARQGLTITPEIELGSIDLLIEFARIGLGISFITKEFITAELESEMLFEIQLEEPISPRKVGIATLKDVPLSLAAHQFIDGLP
jgi:DNA-binding transcriptional LysR family regulator